MVPTILIMTFMAVFLAFLSLYLWVTTAKESPKVQLRKRLRIMATDAKESLPDELRKELLKDLTLTERLTSTVPVLKYLFRLIDQSGLRITPVQFLFVSAAMMALGVLLGIIIGKGYFLPVILACFFIVLPFFYLLYMKRKRLTKFTEQFPDALLMMSRSLRAGHSLSSAIEVISQEMTDPIAGLFKACHEQQNLGMSLRESLAALSNNVDSLDLRFFITTVNIHREIGGNLTELLDKLGETIRERLKIRRQVRVHTAQGRLSGYILAILPIFTFFMFYILFPGYEDELIKTPKGNYIIIIAAIAQIIGFLIIRKIINIRI